MQCTECREELVAYLEGALDAPIARACQIHLETCSGCRQEQAALAGLQQQLIRQGRAAARVSLAAAVMSRIRHTETAQSRTLDALWRFARWGLGLGAATAGIVLVAGLLFSPRSQALASEVLAKGAKAAQNLRSIHLRCAVRTAPADNFSQLDPQQEFAIVELWKQFGRQARWKIEKPGRVALMDGQSTVLWLRAANYAMKFPPTAAAFDTGWLHGLADIADTIESARRTAAHQGWTVSLTNEIASGGVPQSVVTILAKSGLPNGDYLKNKFFSLADTRRVYRFDDQTGRLQAAQVYLQETNRETLVFEITRIDYDPVFAPAVFTLDLPQNVVWRKEPQRQAGDEAYTQLSAEEAARTFFEACANEKWEVVAKFWELPVDDKLKAYLGGLKVLHLGKMFTSALYEARFVPYEIQLRDGRVKKWNLALKKHRGTELWYIDGGL